MIATTAALCAINGCGKPRHQRRRYCGSHAMRAYRYGDPNARKPQPRRDLIGQVFGLLTVLETDGYHWRCKCECGAIATIPTGNLNRGQTTCGNRTTHRREATVGYYQAHKRLTVDRGPASAHACVDCGQPAQHWSYSNASPDELTDVTGLRYSLNQDDYQPRCAPCHSIHDGKTTRAA
ncbi:hypothetical protein [Microcella frigidaquae]|uniref:Uncharacterized protein n=1 Tax=Microcella frigidaquae TaxID=424758 RepID=A0A840XFC6_9MICO|nr:hypothetical protein [Microcella frigidaquae]MBB5617212.1 hypothetical protein [Microcella frigidaquae]NHN45087.1 hypothetical protein [Microcella frigidaquae]